jgi:UPF0755 protein
MAGGRVLKLVGLSLGGLVVLAALFWVGLKYLDYLMDAPGPERADQAPTTLILQRGQGLAAIAAQLETMGAIRDGALFRVEVWRLNAGRELKAGEYAIPSGASMRAIITMMREGRVLLHKLTLPEGWTTAQALRLVAADPNLAGMLTRAPPEGALLPDTYLFTRGEQRDAIVTRMERAQRDYLAGLWPSRAADLPVTTPFEALILASIVEKETARDNERARVAAVYVNRLKKRMRLQSDPTIIYGITKGEPLGRGIRQSELAGVTPYNTYQIEGLPPTPIANPGRAAIAAVLNPAATDDLFFVANGTGGHSFTASAEEQARNAARWHAIERQRAAGKP